MYLRSSSMREKRSRRRRAGRKEETASRVLSSTTDDFAVDSGISPKASTSKLQSQGAPSDASPDSKCPICLDRFDNVSHLDRCLHRFCFRCIQEWAKNKAECPLCKQPFNSIFHSVRAEDDFKEYVLRPTLNGSFGSPDGHRFRYRTTMTRDNYLSLRTLRSSSRRTFSPPDNGVLFEGISNVSSQQRGSDIHQMMRRLASRRQASTEGRTMRQIQEQELINFRRALYRAGLRVRNIQDGGRYRDISAEFFCRNPACLHRLVPWLKRELTVLFGSHGSLVNIVQHIIMRNVTLYDMESQAFVEDLQPFFLHRTDHFIHEFISFARCPYNIEAYDHHANYDCPAPSYEEGSQSESSVITISPDEVSTREPDVPSSSLDVGQTPWDDETPGPSYTSVDQTVSWTTNISDEQPTSSIQTGNDAKSAAEDLQGRTVCVDDCVIVGFVKPLAERTPELVELSSDSEGSLCEVKIEQTKKPQDKPFTLIDSSGSSRSSSPLSSHSSEKDTWKFSRKQNTSDEKSLSKKKEPKPNEASSKHVVESRKDKRHSHNNESSRRRTRSQSSDCYSRSSRNRAYESRSRKHRKNSPRSKKSPDKSRHRTWREKRRSRSRDRSSSWRSRTVSLTSESSRERGGSRSTSRNLSRGRSRSRDSDNDYTADNYRSTYQWEYTYYSRNRVRDGYEQSFRKHARGKGHYSRPSSSPEYRVQSYSARRDLRRKKGIASAKQHHHVRNRSRSRSRSRTNASGLNFQVDKPAGKRKYKTRHLERQEEKKRELEAMQGNPRSYKDDLTETSSNEPKRRKKTRSPSVEIVYEGKATEGSKCHKKKKKKKHKKKRRHEHPTNSSADSPIIITINSDSDAPTAEDTPSSDKNAATPAKSSDQDSAQSATSLLPSTSATADITEPASEEPAGPSSKDYDLFSSNGHLDAATGILDGLHFDDSSDEQALPTSCSPSNLESAQCEEAAMAEFPLPDSKSEQEAAVSTSHNFLMDSQENLSENSQLFAETISELLESITTPSVL
ncbi:hypothetical protein GDO78_006813 [Eleutherodactylus coqui]|uniref:E3 ubiquitin-protein ligase Topors n=1 Tax=Eleutherodactylus coqui TaxID=57060 RepID=A0A8J6KF35_ELECQ|nr:hypothetical protein GDO78_006813 [Eleutherodactylus coqui]